MRRRRDAARLLERRARGRARAAARCRRDRASSPLGWRCSWPGRARLCVDWRADVPGFTCAGDRCTQAHARRPDDGEWTCVDTAGAEVCEGAGRAAGVDAGARRPGVELRRASWRGLDARRTHPSASTFRPTSPTATSPRGVVARKTVRRRRASASAGPRRAGSASRAMAARPCVDGAICASGRCVPARPAPSCWLDDDCPGGACRFGTCRDEATP